MAGRPMTGLGSWTLHDFCGFETGPAFSIVAEGQATDSGQIVSTPSPPNSAETYLLKITQDKAGNSWTSRTHTPSTATLRQGIAWYTRFGDVWPPENQAPIPEFELLAVQGSGVGNNISVRMTVDGSGNVYLNLVDSGGVVRDTSSANPVTDDTWYLFELWFEKDSIGGARLYVDGSLECTVSGEDFDSGSSTDFLRFEGQGGDGLLAGPTTVYVNSWYWISGITDENDFLDDETGSTPGDTLESGAADDASDNDTTSEFGFSTTGLAAGFACDEVETYGRPGPLDDGDGFNAGAKVIGAKWVHNVTYTGPLRGNNNTHLIYGYEKDGVFTVTDENALRVGGFPNIIKKYDDAPLRVPDGSEHAVIGFHKNGGLNPVYLKEGWCFLLCPSPIANASERTLQIDGLTQIDGFTNLAGI